jgi:PAS domain S-box-containing protein
MSHITSAEKQALAASISTNIVVIINTDFTISWVNKQFTATTGFSETETVGNRISDLLHGPLTDNAKVQMLHREVELGHPIHDQIVYYTKDKRPFWVKIDAAPVFDENDQLEGYIIIDTDITENRFQEEELKRTRTEISDMFEHTFVPMCYNDNNGTFLKVNQAFCDLFECKEEDLIGKDYIDTHFRDFPVSERMRLRKEAAEFLISDRVYRREFKLTTLKKNLLIIEVVMKTVVIGHQPMVSVYMIDKTEKREFEGKIMEQNKRLKEFAFLTSHKLRQPLANILGLIELVKSEAHAQQDVTITFETLRMLTGQLDDVVHEMNKTLAELDIEAEKNLFITAQEDKGIHNVWIVDDDQVITYVTNRLLKNVDPTLHVTEFLSAKMALEKLRLDENCPDILLLDINMPGINGWEFLEELGRTRHFVNVYMYSSSIDPEDVKRARAYPMVREFLSKPLDMNTIRHLLDVPLIRSKVS